MANEKHNLITWLGFTTEPDFSKARLLGHAIGYGFVALYVCVFLLLVGGLMWTISHVPDIIDDVIYATDASEARWLLASLAALTAVTSAVVALPFTVLKTIYNRRQTHVAEQSHLTDQINKAVENLVANKEDATPDFVLRVSGILSLVQIAKNDPFTARQCEQILLRYIDVRVGKRNFLDRSESSRFWGPIVYDINSSAQYGADWKNKAHDVLSAFEALEEIKSQWT